jgi:hypothetical protein
VFEDVASPGSFLRGSSLPCGLSTHVHDRKRDNLGSVDNTQRFHTSLSANGVFQSVLENKAVLFSKLQQNHIVSIGPQTREYDTPFFLGKDFCLHMRWLHVVITAQRYKAYSQKLNAVFPSASKKCGTTSRFEIIYGPRPEH